MSDIRNYAKHTMRERARHHVYLAGHKLRRGRRHEFRAVLPDGSILLQGWFVADGPDPVCRR